MMIRNAFKVLVICFAWLVACSIVSGAPVITGYTQDGRLFYKQGETAKFYLRLEGLAKNEPQPAKWKWQLKRDNAGTLEGREEFVCDQPLMLDITLDHPGFVHINAELLLADGSTMKIPGQKAFNGGLGFDAEKCLPNPAPADFDEYWAEQKRKLAEVPLEPKVTEVPSLIEGSQCFAVVIPCAGPAPVTGYLVIPKGAKGHSLPAMAVFHGYGFPRHTPPKRVDVPQIITFNVNAHGMKLNMTPEEYEKAKAAAGNYGFSMEENKNRDTAYFHGMALRAMRAMEYLKTVPQWNGKELIVNGGSQGALQSIWAASLDEQVTQCQILIPWCCDLGGIEHGRYSATWRIPYTPALDYYDAAIHASRIRAQVNIYRAGMGDTVCPPSGIAAFFNNLRCPAKIRWVQGSTHDYVPADEFRQVLNLRNDFGKPQENEDEQAETLLTPKGEFSADIHTESYYWMKEKIPATGERAEHSAFYTDKDFKNDTRLFDGKDDWKHSVCTEFCDRRPKHLEVKLDLKTNCEITKASFTIPPIKQPGNFPATCQLYVSDTGFEPSQMMLVKKYANPYPSIKDAPGTYDFEMETPKGTRGRYVKLVLETKTAIILVSELKLHGRRLGKVIEASLPQAWRLEPENIPGFVREGEAPNILGKFVSCKMQVATVQVPKDAAGKKIYVFARYRNNGEQGMTVICDGQQTILPAQTQEQLWSWHKICETEKNVFTVLFRRTGKYAPFLDSMIITTDATFNPNKSSLGDLVRIPVIAHIPGYGETLAKNEPNLSPEEFAEKLAIHYNIPKQTEKKQFFTPEGAFLWNGKPVFPVTFFFARPDDKRLDDMPLNSFFGELKVNSRSEEYGLIPMYHDEWYAYDMLTYKLQEKSGDSQIMMHYICDEPANVGVSIKDLARMNAVVKRLDPNHPTFVNDVPASAGNPQLMQIADCIGIDHYPVPDGRIFDIGYSIDMARVTSGGRPVVFVAQAFDWSVYKRANGRWPTPDEISAMTWLPIIHGARGLWFYEFPAPGMNAKTCIKDVNPAAWTRLLEIVKVIRRIEPELVGAEADFPGKTQEKTAKNHPVSLRFAIRNDKTEAVLIVANAWETPAELTLDWNNTPDKMTALTLHGASLEKQTVHLEPFGTALFCIQAPWLSQVKALNTEQALDAVRRRLEKNNERPEINVPLQDKVTWNQAGDLLDSWKCQRKPDSARLCATAAGLHCRMSMRIPKNAVAKIDRRDGDVWRDTCIELFLGNKNGKTGAHLMVNLKNVQADGYFDLNAQQTYDWKVNYAWTSKVSRGSENAEFEITIPWEELKRMTGLDIMKEDIILFNLASSSANFDWAGLSGGSFLLPGKFGVLHLPAVAK